MMNIIVVGVDGSETAREAARKAAWLAEAAGAQLHLVMAYGYLEERTIRTQSDDVLLTPRDDAAAIAAAECTLLSREFPALSIRATEATGRPARALVTYAESVDADLIVVGNKRVQGLARLLGSVANDVTQHAHCDVFVAHTSD